MFSTTPKMMLLVTAALCWGLEGCGSPADAGSEDSAALNEAAGKVTLLAGEAGVEGADDGVGERARFNKPSGITYDGKFLYVSDTKNGTVRKIDIVTRSVTTLAGRAGGVGVAPFVAATNDGTGADASFTAPADIAYGGDGAVYLLEAADTVRRVDINTAAVTTLVGNPTTFAPDGYGKFAELGFAKTRAIVSDNKGTLYVTDGIGTTLHGGPGGFSKVRRINVATREVTSLPTFESEQFDRLRSVAFDAAKSSVYVVNHDRANQGVLYEIGLVTRKVERIRGTSVWVDFNRHAPEVDPVLGATSAMTVENGSLYFAGGGAGSIHKLTLPANEMIQVAKTEGCVTDLVGLGGGRFAYVDACRHIVGLVTGVR